MSINIENNLVGIILSSKPMNDYWIQHNKLAKIVSEGSNKKKISNLDEEIQQLEFKLKLQIDSKGIVTRFLNYFKNKAKLKTIAKMKTELKSLSKKSYSAMETAWGNLIKEILNYYPPYNKTKQINSEELEIWQKKLVDNCELLQNKINVLLEPKLLKLGEIVKTLTNDLCSKKEFQRITEVKITGNNQFLAANIRQENKSSKSNNSQWNKDVTKKSNKLMEPYPLPPTSISFARFM